MTARQTARLVCSRCQHQFSTELWGSINVTLDPQLKERLLAGEINVVQCPSCQTSSYVAIPFIYHDMEKRLFIYAMPEKLFKKDEVVRQAIKENSQQTWREFAEGLSEKEAEYLRTPRVVYGLRALLEEILVCDGYDRQEVRFDWAYEFIRRLFASKSADEIVSLLRSNLYLLDQTFFDGLQSISRKAESNGDGDLKSICQAIEAEARRIMDEDRHLPPAKR